MTRRPTSLARRLAWVAALWSVTLLGPGRADARAPATAARPGATVLLVPLASEGLAAADHRQLSDSLHAAFDHAELTVVAPDELDACAGQPGQPDEPCLRALGRAHSATHVVQVHVVADGRDFAGELRVVAVDDPGPASLVDASCEICGLSEFDDRLAARAVAARDLILATPVLGRVEVLGVPEHARVRIDRRLRGRGPVEAELEAGPHQVAVSAPGHYRELVPIVTAAGVTQRVEVDLRPKPRLAWQRPTGWALLGSGTASTVTGIALIAADGSTASSRCRTTDPEVVDPDGDCRWLRATQGAGITFTTLGIVAAGVGTGLILVDASRARARKTGHALGPQLRLGLGLARVDLRLRF